METQRSDTRVLDFYRRPSRWSIDKEWVLLTRQRVERSLAAALRQTETRLGDADLLDVGTGGATYLNILLGLGATPARCHGIDLVPERIAFANQRCPANDLRVADVRDLPYPDASFDVVSQFTCFSNLSEEEAQLASSEVRRVLRPTGRLIWFDLFDTSPGEVTRPIARPEDLFSGFHPLWRRPLLHPWTELLNSRLVLSELVERLPVRKTNLLMVFAVPDDGQTGLG